MKFSALNIFKSKKTVGDKKEDADSSLFNRHSLRRIIQRSKKKTFSPQEAAAVKSASKSGEANRIPKFTRRSSVRRSKMSVRRRQNKVDDKMLQIKKAQQGTNAVEESPKEATEVMSAIRFESIRFESFEQRILVIFTVKE